MRNVRTHRVLLGVQVREVHRAQVVLEKLGNRVHSRGGSGGILPAGGASGAGHPKTARKEAIERGRRRGSHVGRHERMRSPAEDVTMRARIRRR